MAERFLSPSGNDANSGTFTSPWLTLGAANQRLQPGDTLTLLEGVHRGTFNPASGTAQAPITLKAVSATARIEGGWRALSWTKDAQGTWSIPWSLPAFGAWQSTYEKLGRKSALFWRVYNQYGSNPMLDINPADPAPQFKLKNGRLYVRTEGNGDPTGDLQVVVAITELAIDLNDRSHVIIDGVTTRHHKSAVGTRGGDDIHLVNCDFGRTGVTGVWLVKLTNSEMVKCRIQGSGSWAGHYEDCCQVNGCSPRIAECDISFGGHCGILCLGPGAPVIEGNRFHDMGGTLLLLKQEINGARVRNNQFRGAAWVRDLTVHRVPHAAIQLSGDDNRIENNLFEQNGVHILATSTNVQSCRRNQILRNTFQDSEGAALDFQEVEAVGGLAGNVIQSNIIRRGDQGKWADGSPQTRLVFFAFANRAGQGLGDNRFEDNFVDASGQVALNGGKVSATNDSTRTENRGAALPTNGGDGPVDTTAPVLDSLTPSTGGPGTIVTATGRNLAAANFIVWSTAGAYRLGLTRLKSRTDTEVTLVMPGNIATGPVYARIGTETSARLTFTVGSQPPPPVNKPPVANAGGPYTGTVGVPVQFDGSRSSDPDGTIASYKWQFADGGTAEGVKPTHIYQAAGTYLALLTVTDDKGVIATAQANVSIAAAPPPPVGLSVTVGASASQSGAIYEGNVLAGGPLPAGSTITVSAKTPDGRTATGTATIAGTTPPANLPPVANAGGPYTGTVGVAVAFDGSQSAGMGGTIVRYEWKIANDDRTFTGPKLSLVFTTPGTYTVTLTVTDDKGVSATATTTAAIVAAPPPPTDPNRVEDVFEFMGTPVDQALLRSAFDDLHYPWGSMKPGLQRVGLSKVRVEFADLSWAGAALETADGEKLTRVTVGGDASEDDDHTHVVWGGMIPGVGGDVAHYVVGLAWTSGLLQIEQSIKSNTALVKQVVGFEGAHHTDFFYVSLDGDGLGSRHARLLELAFSPDPVTGQWWGGHYPDTSYFKQVGESWMAALAIAYGDNAVEDRRFTPYFKLSQAAQIRNILGLPRTDGKT
jgi:PKD repeat protein